MANHTFPSFNFPYTSSEDLRQYFVDYGRAASVYVFKDGDNNVECIPQKKEINANRIVKLVSEIPVLPLNLPGKVSGKINVDFKSKFEPARMDVKDLWDYEQPVTNIALDHGDILFGELAEVVGVEAEKSSWRPPQPLPFFDNTKIKITKLDPILKGFQNDFCDIPLGLLGELVQEACEQERLMETGKCYGNCLAYARTMESDIVLVYPSGETMSDLCFNNLEIVDKSSAKLCARKMSFNLPERICQVNMTSDIGQNSIIAVRTDNKCWFFGNGFAEGLKKPSLIGNLQCKTKPCAVTVNPYIPEEVLATMETGSLWLWSMEDSSVRVARQCSACTPGDFGWYFSEFGSHPRQVIRGNHMNVQLIDFRGDSSTDQDLISLPSSHFFPDDTFTAIQRHHDNPYHYFLATTQSLVIMDERFQQHPVLKWSHSLEYPPKYISVLPDPTSQDVLVFVGSYERHNIHCFQYCHGEVSSHLLGMADDLTGILPPRSTSAPWKISSYSDWPEMVDYPNKAESYCRVNERLSQPLLGLSFIPQSTTSLVTVVQLSNKGDLFYQSLFPRESSLTEVRGEGGVLFYEDFDIDFTSSGGCGSRKANVSKKDEEFITKWVECLMEHANEEGKDMLEELGNSCYTEDVGLIREELFSSLNVEVECSLCSGKVLNDASGSSDKIIVVCPYCELSRELSDKFYEVTMSERRILTREYLGLSYEPETLNMFNEDIHSSEPLGNILLRNWNSTEQEAIDLTTESQNTCSEGDKEVMSARIVQTDEVAPARKVNEDGRSPFKKKCLIISPNQLTSEREEYVSSETVGKSPGNLTEEFSSFEGKNRTSNAGSRNQTIQSQNLSDKLSPSVRNPMSSATRSAVGQSRTPMKKKVARGRVAGF